jgi:hypothetical protein
MPEQIHPFKVRKLPVEVDAMPTTGITGATLEDVAAWCGGYVLAGRPPAVLVPTPEGNMIANFGDWIVKGIEGEFHPVRGAIFSKTYEMVSDPTRLTAK